MLAPIIIGLFVLVNQPLRPQVRLVTSEDENAPVSALVFSPDGRLLVSGGDTSGMIKVWDVHSHHSLHTLRLAQYVWSLSFSNDGKFLVAAGVYFPIQFWSATTWKEIWTIQSAGGILRIWDIRTSRIVRVIEKPYIYDPVIFSPDGSLLVSGSSSGIRVWNTQTWILKYLFQVPQQIDRLAFTPDGNALVGVDAAGHILVWNMKDGQLITSKLLQGAVNSVAFSPDGKLMLTGASSSDENAVIWNTRTWQKICTLEDNGNMVDSVAFSNDGKTIATGTSFGEILLWNRFSLPGCR
ncbi:MAG: hypothetical protein M3Y56_08885 [Armatimonadota bacterium]|nr:hypothetical protein [Armatimonadota bacterium]